MLDIANGTHRLFYANGDSGEPDKYHLSSNSIDSFFEDNNGDIWIATRGGGLSVLGRQTGEFVHYRHQQDDPTSLSHNGVSSIVQDDSGNLWIGSSWASCRAMRHTLSRWC